MEFTMKTNLPREAMPETVSMYEMAKKLPVEKQENLFQFWRGVSYGLDMAGCLTGRAWGGERARTGAEREGR